MIFQAIVQQHMHFFTKNCNSLLSVLLYKNNNTQKMDHLTLIPLLLSEIGINFEISEFSTKNYHYKINNENVEMNRTDIIVNKKSGVALTQHSLTLHYTKVLSAALHPYIISNFSDL